MSEYGERVIGRRGYGLKTESFGTVITRLIEPMPNGVTRLTGVTTTTLTTAHLLTLMRPCNRVQFTADAAAGQKVVYLSADPGVYSVKGTLAAADTALAASDYVVYEAADGTFVMDLANSVYGAAGVVTLTTNLPTGGVKKGGLVWFYGIVTELNPNNNAAHPRWNLAASTTNVFGRGEQMASLPDHKFLDIGGGCYQPLILHIDNGTAASVLESVGVEYVTPAVGAQRK